MVKSLQAGKKYFNGDIFFSNFFSNPCATPCDGKIGAICAEKSSHTLDGKNLTKKMPELSEEKFLLSGHEKAAEQQQRSR